MYEIRVRNSGWVFFQCGDRGLPT